MDKGPGYRGKGAGLTGRALGRPAAVNYVLGFLVFPLQGRVTLEVTPCQWALAMPQAEVFENRTYLVNTSFSAERTRNEQ